MQGHKSITSSIQSNNHLNKNIFGQMQSIEEASVLFRDCSLLKGKVAVDHSGLTPRLRQASSNPTLLPASP